MLASVVALINAAGTDEPRALQKGVASMRRVLLVFAVAALLAAMVVITAFPAFAASQKYCFAAQRSADASGNGPTLVTPPFPNEGTYLSGRHTRNSDETHKCF
jgi:hypothetical protein